jgi:electron transport complex protein RnfG
MKEPKFKNQFDALNLAALPGQEVKVKKDGGTIDAITAATISSRAFCDGVQKAYFLYMKNFGVAGIVADTSEIVKGDVK